MQAKQTLRSFKNMLLVAMEDVDHILLFDETIKESITFILDYSEQYPEDVDEKTTEKTFEFLVEEYKEFLLTDLAGSVYHAEWEDDKAPKVGTPSDWFNFLTLDHGNDEAQDRYEEQVLYFAKQMKP